MKRELEKAEKNGGDLGIRKKGEVGSKARVWDLVEKQPWAHLIRSRLRAEKTGWGFSADLGPREKNH